MTPDEVFRFLFEEHAELSKNGNRYQIYLPSEGRTIAFNWDGQPRLYDHYVLPGVLATKIRLGESHADTPVSVTVSVPDSAGALTKAASAIANRVTRLTDETIQ